MSWLDKTHTYANRKSLRSQVVHFQVTYLFINKNVGCIQLKIEKAPEENVYEVKYYVIWINFQITSDELMFAFSDFRKISKL